MLTLWYYLSLASSSDCILAATFWRRRPAALSRWFRSGAQARLAGESSARGRRGMHGVGACGGSCLIVSLTYRSSGTHAREPAPPNSRARERKKSHCKRCWKKEEREQRCVFSRGSPALWKSEVIITIKDCPLGNEGLQGATRGERAKLK